MQSGILGSSRTIAFCRTGSGDSNSNGSLTISVAMTRWCSMSSPSESNGVSPRVARVGCLMTFAGLRKPSPI